MCLPVPFLIRSLNVLAVISMIGQQSCIRQQHKTESSNSLATKSSGFSPSSPSSRSSQHQGPCVRTRGGAMRWAFFVRRTGRSTFCVKQSPHNSGGLLLYGSDSFVLRDRWVRTTAPIHSLAAAACELNHTDPGGDYFTACCDLPQNHPKMEPIIHAVHPSPAPKQIGPREARDNRSHLRESGTSMRRKGPPPPLKRKST